MKDEITQYQKPSMSLTVKPTHTHVNTHGRIRKYTLACLHSAPAVVAVYGLLQ